MTNDSAGAGATLLPASVKLCQVDDPTTLANEAETANSCTQSSVIAYDPVTQAIQGTYTVANGIITFTPAPEFDGTATPVSYVISDNLGQTLNTTYTPTTLPPALPGAMDDSYSTFPLTPITFNVVTNDNLGSFPLDPTSVRLCEVVDVPPACSATTVSDELGTLVVDTATGQITFTPTALFTEATPVHWRYAIADTRGHFTFANITIVDPPLPTPITRAADLAYTGMNLLGGPVSTSGLISLLVGIALFASTARKQKFRLATAVFLDDLKASTFRALDVDKQADLPETTREYSQREEWSSRPD
jgi:CshA-type fibril repeat protein